MENNLDKYFREQLNDRRFELKDAYWLQAQAMLEATEKQRKRRVFFWWSSGGIIAAALLVLLWLVLSTNDKPTNLADNKASNNLGQNEMANSQDNTTIASSNLNNNHDENALVDQANASKQPIEKRNHSNLPNREGSRHKDANSNSTRSPFLKNNSVANNATANDIRRENATAVDEQGFLKQDGTFNTGETKRQIDEQVPIDGQNSLHQNALINESYVKTSDIAQLPTLLVLVEGNFGRRNLVTATQPEKIEVVKKSGVQYGLLLAGIVRPSIQNTEKSVLGLRTGLNIQFNLNTHWHIATGLNYHYRSGSFAPSKSATQRNYRFGLELDTLLLRPKNLHYFSLPILLGYEHNKHQLQAGICFDILTGVRGETGSYQKQGEPPVKRFTPEKAGWVNHDGYKPFVPTAQLNYQYSLGRHWSAGFSAYYSFGGIIDAGFTPPIGSFLLKEADKLTLGLQLAYRIN